MRKKKPIAGGAPRARAARGLQRQRLIEACISALHIHGPSRTTVEKVVAIAKMSPGIVRFYFDSKAAMLVASLQFLAAEFEERVLQPIARLKSTPVAALELLVDLYLDPEIASPRKVSVWYAFWGEASSRQEYYDICGQKDESFAAMVRELIGVLEILWQDFAFRSEEDINRDAAKRRCMAYLRSVFPGRFAPTPGAREPAARDAAGGFAGWVYGNSRAALLERDALFRCTWQIAAHVAQIPRAGDFVTADLGAERVVVVRDAYGVLHALRNSCPEVPHALVVEMSGHSAGTFRCRAHGVEFDFEGRSVGAGQGNLTRLGLHTADQLIWVGPPGAQHPQRRQAPGGMSGGREPPSAAPTVTEREIEVAANWKLLVEQWLEAVPVEAVAAASADSISWSTRPLEGGTSFSARCYRALVKDAGDEPWPQRFVAPNQLLQWRPDGLTVIQAIPASPQTCRLRLISVGRRPEGPEARAGHYLAARLLHWTRASTRAVAESAQRGVADFGYRAGPGVAPGPSWFRRYLTAHVPALAFERPPA